MYLVSTTGTMVIVDAAADEYSEIARCELGTGVANVHASPAFAGGKIYIRSRTNLWCIGAAEAAPGK